VNLCNQDCKNCPLAELRNCPPLSGQGNLSSKVIFIFDAPSAEDDATGKPFSGPAARKLDSVLAQFGIHRSQVYYTYATRCRANLRTAEGVRPAHFEEIQSCSPYLEQEINEIHPNIIVPMGAEAISSVLNIKKVKVGEVRGIEQYSERFKCKVLPTLSIGSVLRNPSQEEVIAQDIRRAIESSKVPEMTQANKGNYIVIDTLEKLESFFERIMEQEEVAVDLETTGFDWQKDKIICSSFSWKVGTGVLLPVTKWVGIPHEKIVLKDKKVRRKGKEEIKQVEVVEKWMEDTYAPWWGEHQQYVMMKFRQIMESDIKFIAQNGKFDWKFLLQMGWKVKPLAYDTLLMHYLLRETDKGGHNLEDMSLQYLGRGQHKKELDDWFKANKMGDDEKRNYARVPETLLYSYGACDADVTLELKQVFLPRIEQEGMADLLSKLVMPLDHTLTHMEFEGFQIDRKALNKAKEHYQTLLTEEEKGIKEEIAKVTSEEINLDSPKQLSKLLFETLKLPIIKMTKSVTKPVPSTDEDVLNQLADKHPICQKIVEYRGLAKMLNTYVIGIEERLDDNAILHTKYHQPGTTTGRLSSTDPNFQNFPRSEKLIKNMFIVKKGNVLIEADEGQNEFRWWGILSGDPQLVRDLNDGVDIHRFIAALANKIPQEQVDDTQRKKAKSIVFGLMFGEGVDDLSKKHGVTVEYAQTIKDTFFSRYPTAKQWRYEIVKFARKNLFVQSRFGRRRHLLAINNPDNKIAYKDEQAACNAPIQGSASDYVSNAANRVFLRLQEEGLHGKLRNLVHDAIYVEVPKAEIRQTLQIMHEEMTRRILGIQVPLTVDAKIGVRWGRMHKIEVVNNTQKQVAN